MSNVEILGRPKYRPIKSNFQEDSAKFYAKIQSELIKGKPRNFTDLEDLVYDRSECLDEYMTKESLIGKT